MTLRFKFDSKLRELVRRNLQRHKVRRLHQADRSRAAVAFTLVDASESADIGNISLDGADREEAAFILTTRAASLSSHAGQRAYPGGRVDAGESMEQAALRELAEEVGLDLDRGSVLGRLDDYGTRSGFVITPIVVWGCCATMRHCSITLKRAGIRYCECHWEMTGSLHRVPPLPTSSVKWRCSAAIPGCCTSNSPTSPGNEAPTSAPAGMTDVT